MTEKTVCAHCKHYSSRKTGQLGNPFSAPPPPPQVCLARRGEIDLVTGIAAYISCYSVNDGACALYAMPEPVISGECHSGFDPSTNAMSSESNRFCQSLGDCHCATSHEITAKDDLPSTLITTNVSTLEIGDCHE